MLKGIHSSTIRILLFSVISLLIVAVYCIYFNSFKVNYPQHEDALMARFVMEWDNSSWEKRIDDWGGFTFGHRYYYARAISLISAKLNGGELDLTKMMTGGIVMSALFATAFLWLLRNSQLSAMYLLPALFLLFNPILRDYIFWALTNQLYPPSLFFSILAIILVLKNGRFRFLLAIISALIAAGSFSSGLLVFPIIALVLFLRRKYYYLAFWLLTLVITFALYFRNYNTPGWGLPYISAGDPNFTILNKLVYLLSCTGSPVIFEPREVDVFTIFRPRFWPSLLVGTLCWIVLAYGIAVSWFGYYFKEIRQNSKLRRVADTIQNQYHWFQSHPQVRLFFTSVAFLLLITLYLVVVGRTTTSNGYQIFEKRLKLYPVITLILAYCMAICLAQGKRFKLKVFYTSLAGSVLIWSYSYFFLIYQTSIESRNFKTLLFNYTNNNNAYLADYGTWAGSSQQFVKSNYESAIQNGVLTLNNYDYLKNAVEDPGRLPDLTTTLMNNGDYNFMIPGQRTGKSEAERYYVILRNKDHEFLVNLYLSRNTLIEFLKTRQYYIGELFGFVAKTSLPDGTYRIGLLKTGTNPIYGFKNESITIKRNENEWW